MSLPGQPWRARIEGGLGEPIDSLAPLTGGCIAEVYRVDRTRGAPLVAKVARDGGLALEGRMLSDLARLCRLPVPEVLVAEDDLLIMTFVESGGYVDASAEGNAAELLAALHDVTADAYGYPCDTLIGPLPQPNPWTADWAAFFRDQRLMPMGRRAAEAGNLSAATLARLERLCAKLETWIDPPAAPSLVHGDIWGGNVLVRDGGIAAFLDPAIYYADAEVELAYIAMFNTFGRVFFERYQDLRPLRPGFEEARRDLYALFPLLVHATLFGGSYPGAVDRILKRFVG